jgi:hypothetical protein
MAACFVIESERIFPAANADTCQVIFAAPQGKSIITSPELISHTVIIAKVRA